MVTAEAMDVNEVVDDELTAVEPERWLALKLLIVEVPP
jgi:hypothetical protein